MITSKRSTAQRDKQEMQELLHDKVLQIVKSWRESPELISDYLLFAGHFRKYSHSNTRLIYAQSPGASFVGVCHCVSRRSAGFRRQ